MKRLYTLLIVLLAAFSYAQDQVVLDFRDGSKIEIALNENPVIRLDAVEPGNYTINVATQTQTLDFEFAEVYGFHLETLNTESPNFGAGISLYRQGDIITLSGISTHATLWDISGKFVQIALNDDSFATLDVSKLATGIYLIKVDHKTIKLIKK